MEIGVLDIQGDVAEHKHHIEALGNDFVPVKKREQLEHIHGLILPGGESTAIGKILEITGIMGIIRNKILEGLPVWGTCAGMILLAKEIENQDKNFLRVMDITVQRNAYGSQMDSFTSTGLIKEVSQSPIPFVFIRAPYITSAGDNVRVLHRIDGNIVAARQENMLATSFHPELTQNLAFHQYFVNMCKTYKSVKSSLKKVKSF
jgi:5'-phosphate synthase pdxT subunit